MRREYRAIVTIENQFFLPSVVHLRIPTLVRGYKFTSLFTACELPPITSANSVKMHRVIVVFLHSKNGMEDVGLGLPHLVWMTVMRQCR
jgi:hypothetical protein